MAPVGGPAGQPSFASDSCWQARLRQSCRLAIQRRKVARRNRVLPCSCSYEILRRRDGRRKKDHGYSPRWISQSPVCEYPQSPGSESTAVLPRIVCKSSETLAPSNFPAVHIPCCFPENTNAPSGFRASAGVAAGGNPRLAARDEATSPRSIRGCQEADRRACQPGSTR